MRFLYLPLWLIIFLVLESVAIQFLPNSVMQSELLYIPHWILIFSILILLFYDQGKTYHGLMNGIIFGFLTELVYTDLLGVYLLAYGSSLYVIHLLNKLLQQNLFVAIVLSIVGLVIAEFVLFAVYTIVGQVDMVISDFVQIRLIPTTLINLLFLLIIYPVFTKRLIKWQEVDEQMK
ncbi:rod shape-determining protein MreD [Aquisalibacillus elongatus]|uniref:Rod shape-determining protein MreD n=1 Tax=Aquisalibacillus elongatus TaxID=485577 RepID=A0A3N5BCW7_9BACI|nr:rod shape-determining protein MreD [Aquisalibacillus elongatus]RPF55474.1 rod shape-determining protein MreD [Aquisalibacillus elongatus]